MNLSGEMEKTGEMGRLLLKRGYPFSPNFPLSPPKRFLVLDFSFESFNLNTNEPIRDEDPGKRRAP